jgi:hypothetical protein
MPCVYFHDLPVYRLPEDAYNAGHDNEVAEFVVEARLGLDPNPQREKELTMAIGQHYYEKYGPWRFNEIIGYVRLHFLGSQVRGEYFVTKRSRLVRTRKRTLVYSTHKLAPEHHVQRDSTNEQILRVILDYVHACRREAPRRYFDDSWLLTIGPMVDWNAVMKSGWQQR